jgi:hypothetical protein
MPFSVYRRDLMGQTTLFPLGQFEAGTVLGGSATSGQHRPLPIHGRAQGANDAGGIPQALGPHRRESAHAIRACCVMRVVTNLPTMVTTPSLLSAVPIKYTCETQSKN